MLVRLTERVKPESKGSASSLYLLTCLMAGSFASAALGPVWFSHHWHGITMICGAAIVLSGTALLLDAHVIKKHRRNQDANVRDIATRIIHQDSPDLSQGKSL